MSDATTWHHGLVARWWAEFNQGGDDIRWFGDIIERFGEPVLDVGCGTGRLLLPYLEAGLDVDGSDASADMLAWCRKAAATAGVSPRLHRQAMHELDLPRSYRTIINCGAFGLGGSRGDDLEGLRRIHSHLEPGGAFAMDLYLPNFEERSWRAWLPQHKPNLPRPWRRRSERRQAADGTTLELHSRQVAFDPLEQCYTADLRVDHFAGDRLIASEEYRLTSQIYLKNEVVLMLETAGFDEIEVVAAGSEQRPPRPWEDERLILVATHG